jgi:hypothetical protein
VQAPAINDLVVAPAEPALGVMRIVAIVDGDARVLLYKDGTLAWRALSELAPCPPNTPVVPHG